jgi:hypothetical protein
MRRKLALWFVLLIAGFITGLILQYARLQRVQQELSASTKQLGSCQSSEQLSQLRDTPPHFQKYSQSYPSSSRLRIIDERSSWEFGVRH